MLERLGKFRILRQLGQGAMGEVYLGEDPAIGREVALKTIHRELALAPEARERFAREARAAGTLNHPNLVTIHEFGEDQGLLYLAMEYVPGEDLEAFLRARALRPSQILEVLAQVCEGLAYAHGKGVLHRDIKPSNIRVRREGDRIVAKVMDFGVARLSGSDMTGTGTLLGTFGYMAPEYIRTGRPDGRSDLFAVGVILYEALAGRRPFEGDTTATILYRVVHEEPEPLSPSDLEGISPRASALLARALAKDPAARFQDGTAMARALRSAMDPDWEGPATDQPTRAIPRTAISDGRPRRAWPWVAALALLLAGGLGFLGYRTRSAARTGGAAGALAHQVAASVPAPATTPAPAQGPGPAPGRTEPLPQAQPAVTPPGPPPPAEPPARMPEEEAQSRLNEAARTLVGDPVQSLAECNRVLEAHPKNPRAHALKLVALYRLDRPEALREALEAARRRDLDPQAFQPFGAYRMMLREERRQRRLPEDLRRALMPVGPDGRPRPWQGQEPSGD